MKKIIYALIVSVMTAVSCQDTPRMEFITFTDDRTVVLVFSILW